MRGRVPGTRGAAAYQGAALAYGLDYAMVCFLLDGFLFQYRSLTKD